LNRFKHLENQRFNRRKSAGKSTIFNFQIPLIKNIQQKRKKSPTTETSGKLVTTRKITFEIQKEEMEVIRSKPEEAYRRRNATILIQSGNNLISNVQFVFRPIPNAMNRNDESSMAGAFWIRQCEEFGQSKIEKEEENC